MSWATVDAGPRTLIANGGQVPDEGGGGERLVLIGEAPGGHEVARGRPFIGPSGYRWEQWLQQAGLQRADCYITNVYPFRPERNKIETVSKAELAHWAARLHERLGQLRDPWILVPTGNTALKALIGHSGIGKWRGSICSAVVAGRDVKVIPTLHPASTLRMPKWEPRCLADWQRIATDLHFRDLRLPEREHMVRPTLDDVMAVVAEAEQADLIALDVETPGVAPNRTLICLGVALSPSFSCTIPIGAWYWKTPEATAQAWQLVQRLCAAPVPKVLQNGLYDAWWLEAAGAPLRHWTLDTLAMHHALDAAESHTLDFMASLFTRQPFWKHLADAKDAAEGRFARFDVARWDTFGLYNGIDACVTHELAGVFEADLARRGLTAFYAAHYQRMTGPLLRVMRHGLRLDDTTRRRRYTRLMSRCIKLQDQLTQLAGAPLYGPKGDLSAKRVQTFLYETLKLPRRLDRQTHRVTAKETVVRQLMIRHPAKMAEPGRLILTHRRTRKLTEFLAERIVDPDGKVRCTYKFTTSTGRLASAKNPTGRGRNLQNVDREVRDVYVPDEPGWVFVEVDLSQAESRVVDVLTGDPELIRLARLMPWEFDVHRHNAALIFGIPADDVTKEQRYLGKRGVHATHYGLGPVKLSEILLNDGYERTPAECQAMIQAYLGAHPAISRWQRRIRQLIMSERRLRTSWGRELSFAHARLEDDVYREGYAFIPQSEVGDLLNQWGLIPLDAAIRQRKWRSRINAQVHDSLLVSCPPDEAYVVAELVATSLARPRQYLMPDAAPVELTIPAEVKVGLSWAMTPGHEWKRLPARADFDATVAQLLAPVAAP